MSLQNIHLHLNENILFITQDVALASDVWDLGDSRSVRSKRVEVAKITKNGLLEEPWGHRGLPARSKAQPRRLGLGKCSPSTGLSLLLAGCFLAACSNQLPVRYSVFDVRSGAPALGAGSWRRGPWLSGL